ncbi:MAG: hypothetical protein RQ723_09120, partial [Desulfuromonadales bacterium]|nr:hypothetical protein [Desulfuromonadales bacterium]
MKARHIKPGIDQDGQGEGKKAEDEYASFQGGFHKFFGKTPSPSVSAGKTGADVHPSQPQGPEVDNTGLVSGATGFGKPGAKKDLTTTTRPETTPLYPAKATKAVDALISIRYHFTVS